MGVIFLTLFIDLVGFSIIFPLLPDLIGHYLQLEGHGGLLGRMLIQVEAAARWFGHDSSFTAVLFGGVLSSFYSILQFVFAPFWGSVSDRHGRRGVLLLTTAGNALGYVVWACSGSFWLFLVSRMVCGAFSGNLSVATAAVADITTREDRSKAMGLVGAAFGLGLIMGPLLGAFTAHLDLVGRLPVLARLGFNPFSAPALLALAACVVNLLWIRARFAETLTPAARAGAREPRIRNPITAILGLENRAVRRANLVVFIYSVAFVGMEATLTFLAAERFGYTARQNGYLLGFLGLCAVVMQGYIVRRVLNRANEVRILGTGLLISAVGLLWIGHAASPGWLYAGLACLAAGSGLVNPVATGLISLYAGAAEQGRVLGIYRSLGALARAGTPVLAGLVYWAFHSDTTYIVASGLALLAAAFAFALPPARK